MSPPRWTLLFDLDNTLLDSAKLTFPVIESRMLEYIRSRGLGHRGDEGQLLAEARRLGGNVTAIGLRSLVGLDIDDFLAHSHPDSVRTRLRKSYSMLRRLSKVSARMIIVSDGPTSYCHTVLDAMGLGRVFSSVHGIDSMGFVPKSKRQYYRRLKRAIGVPLQQVVLFDDQKAVIRQARFAGVRAALVSRVGRFNLSWGIQEVINPVKQSSYASLFD